MQLTKTGKMYQMTGKYTKWPCNMYTKLSRNRPNGHKICQHPGQDPKKFTQIGIFGSKIWQPCTGEQQM
jgi:hypothetical protein